MVAAHSHDHSHSHQDHGHGAHSHDLHGHDSRSHDLHGHGPHRHGLAAPHPAQAVSWSILRMTVLARFAAALAVSAVLWAFIGIAMK